MNWWLVLAGFSASAAAGAATGLGALPVLLIARLPSRMTDAVLGFAAGVMLAASLFLLIIPGLEAAQRSHGRLSAGLIVTSAILMGAGLIALIERYAPHEHFVHGRQGRSSANVRRIWLFVIAITLQISPRAWPSGSDTVPGICGMGQSSP